jgi:parallel beta-helix repeat protein
VTDNEGAAADDIVVVTVVNPASFYVATNGNDSWTGRLAAPNAGNTDGPFRTLQRAAGVVAPGNTCVVRGGAYNESVTITRSGTAQALLTFMAAPGETVIFDGQGIKDYGLTVHNATHVVLDGFTVRNFRKDGIWLLDFADNVTVRNCTVHGCGGMGIFVRGGDDCVVEYNEVYGNTTGIFVSWRDSNQNYPYRTRVRENLVYDHGILDPESGDGIASDSSLDGTFEHNLCFNNRDDGMDVSIKSMNNVIAHNIALLNGYPETVDGDGNGIKVSTNGGGGHMLHHNFVLLNRRSGLDQDIQPGVPRNYFYSNTAYGNGQAGLMLDSGGRGDSGNNAIVKNNILADNDRLGIDRPDLYACCISSLLESNYNLIADGQMIYTGAGPEGPDSRTGDPKFMNPLATIDLNATGTIASKTAFIRNQVLANFALAPGSPCVGGGTVIPGITVKNPPNIGALE